MPILGTPDFGHSDLWHQNFAFAFHLSQSLKQGYFPIWIKDLGTGFPMLADGEMGMFNFINIILFKFFNPALAFNLTYFFVFLFLITGSYLFARVLKFSRPVAVFFTVVFSFSGLIITQLRSIHIVQAISFFPLEFFLVEKFLQTKKWRWLIIFSLILSQQIYANYQQIVLISLISLGIYISFRNFKLILPVLIFTILGLIFSLPQVLPTIELVKLSFRDHGTALSEMVKYPFVPKNLLSFLNPYFFGNPRIGTYPPFSNNWGIFWESTGYLGILPLVLVLISLKNFRKHLVFWIILGISLILLLGKYTPFFFLFQLPPLNMFRVPARFLLPFVWSLAILAAFGLQQIKNKTVQMIIILFAFADLFYFGFKYHAVINSQKWLEPPQSVKFLQEDKSWFRIYSYWPSTDWNNIFLKKGWQNIDDYFAFRNGLDPNQNLFWNLSSADLYVGLMPRRLEIFKNLIDSGLKPGEVSSLSAKLLSLAGVKYFISPYFLNNFSLEATISGQPNFYIYKNPGVLPHVYLTTDYEVAQTLPELMQKLQDPDNHKVILEEKIDLGPAENPGEATVIKNSDLEIIIQVSANKKSLLILSDSYYPSWKAFIDGQETKIYPANLNQRAVTVPPGSHQVKFKI